jgi:hypothetical protein
MLCATGQERLSSICGLAGLVLCGFLLGSSDLAAQSTYTAQLTGVVSDSSGGVIPSTKIVLTDEVTNVTTSTVTNAEGIYVLTGIRPATYSIRAEAANFGTQERKNVVLAVSQQATINFNLDPSSVAVRVTVTGEPPLLDTGNASLGTDITNEYVRDIPLINRSLFGLVFLAGGVTESAGSGTTDSYPSGTNFVSNGQRNATAEVRLDGALTSAPEQGEGGTTNVYYQPSVEIVQEFKVENNSFSAEYGSNGGTVMNLVLKEGGNHFHGSGWWFGQRSALDANEFFLKASGSPKPDHLRDQYGFSFGGPIKTGKTFFFVDLEKVRENAAVIISGTVPTDAERNGDFSNALETIYDPSQCTLAGVPAACTRPQFSYMGTPNVIPPSSIDPIGQAILKAYPEPNTNLSDPTGLNNFRTSTIAASSGRQLDIKLDHHFDENKHFSGRYSNLHSDSSTPFVLASTIFNDGLAGTTDVHNVGLEFDWTLTSTTLWSSRFAVDRVTSPGHSVMPTLQSLGLPSILAQANGLDRMPSIQMDFNGNDNWLSMYTQCCSDTDFAHTLYSYSSALSFVRGRHTLKVGFEQRQFFNNFYQPNYPTGSFYFPQSITAQTPNPTDPTQGNSFADLLIGYGDPTSLINITPSVADKSWETAFYIQDDWKVNSRLTVNLGLRYEWSTPYTERFNHQQYSDFNGDTGISLVLQSGKPPTKLKGSTVFPGQGGLGRHLPTDWGNIAPRLGFAFSLDTKTVIRGGAGIYYGLNPATNYQYPGTAFSASGNIFFTKDAFVSQYATLENPFPQGLPVPERQKYGKNVNWGFSNSNNVGTGQAPNANIYQWNIGIERLLPGEITIGVDYSANRSNRLPWGGDNITTTRNRNFIPSSTLAQLVQSLNPTHDPNSTSVSDFLNSQVANPFLPFFQGPSAIFNEPASLYNFPMISEINLLRPYPQFNGSFTGMPVFGANSFYNSMQIRFQKRANHYISFEGNYTLSKATDDASAGFNAFVGQLNAGNVQQLDRLNLEHAISANDATHRFVIAVILDVPIGRGRWMGKDMNRFLDGVIGGWAASTILTYQTGQPLSFSTAEQLLADGNQRPDILCNQLRSGVSYHQAALNGLTGNGNASIFNSSCFGFPGDQMPGNASRYISTTRGDGIRNADLSFNKEFALHEAMKLQIRGEFFNFTNTPRFSFPDTSVDSNSFGQVTSTVNTPRHVQFGVRFEF